MIVVNNKVVLMECERKHVLAIETDSLGLKEADHSILIRLDPLLKEGTSG